MQSVGQIHTAEPLRWKWRVHSIRTGSAEPASSGVRENSSSSELLKVVEIFMRPWPGMDCGCGSAGSGQPQRWPYDQCRWSGKPGNRGSLPAVRIMIRFQHKLNYSTTVPEDHSLSVGLYQETNFRQVEVWIFTGYGMTTGNLKNEAGSTGLTVKYRAAYRQFSEMCGNLKIRTLKRLRRDGSSVCSGDVCNPIFRRCKLDY